MPRLVQPVIPAGTFSTTEQPTLDHLRPWRETDVPTVIEAFGNPEIQQWHVLRIDDEPEALDWLANWPRRWAAEEAASWAITAPDGTVLGQVGLRSIDRTDATAGLSYWVLPQARGQGAAPAAVATLQRWCQDLGFHRLVIQHSTRNTHSCRVAEKSGYPLEAVLHSCWLHPDGWHDIHVHAQTLTTHQPPAAR